MWPTSEDWDPVGAQTNECRVEVWSGGALITSDAPGVLGGSVSEKRVTGIRSTLSMSVEPSSDWIRWLQLPLLEIRPYLGLSWGGDPELIPMGRFPVDPVAVGVPLPDSVSINATDWWGWAIGMQSLDVPIRARSGLLVRDSVWFLMSKWSQLIRRPPLITATSLAHTVPVVWDGSVQEIIGDLVRSIGAEAFFDREGVPVIQDRRTSAAPPLTSGEGGTIINVDPNKDWSQVFNRMAISSSNQDLTFQPVIASITDPDHPAHESRIGRRVAPGYSSPYFRSRQQAIDAGPSLLAPYSEPALTLSVTALPDPSRMPGDRSPVVTLELGSITAVIDEVTHDFLGAPMQMKMVAP